MNLIPLNELPVSTEFWAGTKLRHYNVGMNVEDKHEDFYDYMLVYANWFVDHMILVDITKNNGKEGQVYAGTPAIDPNRNAKVVDIKALKHTLGEELEDWYLIEAK